MRAEQDKDAMNVFEVVFIIFASAFTLAEYTASQEHGWGSELLLTFAVLILRIADLNLERYQFISRMCVDFPSATA